MSELRERIWFCKIGGHIGELLPGSDLPMRQAIQAAFEQVTGHDSQFTFSGWGGLLTEGERAVVENRRPALPAPPRAEVDVECLAFGVHARILEHMNRHGAILPPPRVFEESIRRALSRATGGNDAT